MVRVHADRSDSSKGRVYDPAIAQTGEHWPTESVKRRPWPVKAIVATYRHLAEGVRLLGEAYAAYDDRNIH